MKRIAAVMLTGVMLLGLCSSCDDSGTGRFERLWKTESEARKKAEKQRARWQFYTIMAACAGGVLLVIGAGMGSAAGKAADRNREETDDER